MMIVCHKTFMKPCEGQPLENTVSWFKAKEDCPSYIVAEEEIIESGTGVSESSRERAGENEEEDN